MTHSKGFKNLLIATCYVFKYTLDEKANLQNHRQQHNFFININYVKQLYEQTKQYKHARQNTQYKNERTSILLYDITIHYTEF